LSIHSILIIEDQADGLAYLTQVVQLAFPTVAISSARSLAQAHAVLPTRFDLSLVDLRLGDGLGVSWVAQYRALHATDWVVVTTLFDDDELVFAALRAGVDGYLLKEQSVAELAAALQGLLRGESVISPRIARKVLLYFRSPERFGGQDNEPLTPRESEVLACIGRGLTIKETAQHLEIKYFTVNHHIKAVYRKLSIHTRAEASAEASRLGLLIPRTSDRQGSV
jgi:DNA-binding NarL/FixJ family response regulator